MNGLLRIITVWIILLIILVVSFAAQQDAVDILKKSYAAGGRNTFSSRLKTITYQNTKPISADVNISCSGLQSRMEYLTGPCAKSVIIDDGKSITRLDPSSKTAYILSNSKPDTSLEPLLANYQPIIIGSSSIDGRICYIINLRPKYKGNPSKKLWIDSKTYIPVRTERYNSDGSLTMSTEYTKVDFSAKPSPSLFTRPHGWKLIKLASNINDLRMGNVRSALGFMPVKSRYIPKGYSFDGYCVCEMCVKPRCVGLGYSNGLNTISIFQCKGNCACTGPGLGHDLNKVQNRSVHCRSGSFILTETPQARVLRTQIDDFTITIVGDISAVELKKMASSLK